MKLTVLGSRANIEVRSRWHRKHAMLRVTYLGCDVQFDCGLDWLRHRATFPPSAIFVTHAHPDHIGGLRDWDACPVYATQACWRLHVSSNVREPRLVRPRIPVIIRGITIEAFPVEHSLRAPTVGYRITAGHACLFYVPDVARIINRADALEGISLYIGDGSSIRRPIIRGHGRRRIGHASIAEQLRWCHAEGIKRALFTHCGKEIVGADHGVVRGKIEEMGRRFSIEAQLAHDGMQLVLR